MLRVARVTTVLGAASAAFAASCFTKPDAPHAGADARDLDAMVDGQGTGTGTGTGSGSNSMCTSSGVWDNFDSGTECLPWGTGYGSGSVPIVRTGGTLQVTPNSMGSVYCGTNTTLPIANGISIEIPQIATNTAMYASTFFRVRPNLASGEAFEVRINTMMGTTTPMLALNCFGGFSSSTMLSYSATQHRWWKFELHANVVGQLLHAYHSENGNTWNDLYTCQWNTSATNVLVEMGVDGYPGTNALFDNFNTATCPP
jgi:hypothetical protein